MLVSTIDFRYITDVVTPAEAVQLLKQNAAGKEKREKELLEVGYPCYTTQVGKIVESFEGELNNIRNSYEQVGSDTLMTTYVKNVKNTSQKDLPASKSKSVVM